MIYVSPVIIIATAAALAVAITVSVAAVVAASRLASILYAADRIVALLEYQHRRRLRNSRPYPHQPYLKVARHEKTTQAAKAAPNTNSAK